MTYDYKRCLAMCDELAGVSRSMLQGMQAAGAEHGGLFCHKACLNGESCVEPRGASLPYSASVWIGLCSADGPGALLTTEGAAFVSRVSEILDRRAATVGLGDAGLLLWVDAWASIWRRRLLDIVRERFDELKRYVGTMHLAWLLTGLVRGSADDYSAVRSLMEELVQALLAAYRPKSGLFTLDPYPVRLHRWNERYKNRLASFASQVYSIIALSAYVERFPNARIEGIIREAADALCRSQGPNGEWWWIYNASTGRVYLDYPVYSVHQDAMGPMALLAATAALGGNYGQVVEKSLTAVFDPGIGHVGEPMYDRNRSIVWRAVVKNIPNEDPADLPFGLPAQDMEYMRRCGRPWSQGSPARAGSYRILREARPYCAGWMLLTYAMLREAAARQEVVVARNGSSTTRQPT
jgi:hypothetical protein